MTEKVTNSEVELVTSLPNMVVKLTVTAAERQKYEIEAQLARMVEEEDIMSPLKGNHSHYRVGIQGPSRGSSKAFQMRSRVPTWSDGGPESGPELFIGILHGPV